MQDQRGITSKMVPLTEAGVVSPYSAAATETKCEPPRSIDFSKCHTLTLVVLLETIKY